MAVAPEYNITVQDNGGLTFKNQDTGEETSWSADATSQFISTFVTLARPHFRAKVESDIRSKLERFEFFNDTKPRLQDRLVQLLSDLVVSHSRYEVFDKYTLQYMHSILESKATLQNFLTWSREVFSDSFWDTSLATSIEDSHQKNDLGIWGFELGVILTATTKFDADEYRPEWLFLQLKEYTASMAARIAMNVDDGGNNYHAIRRDLGAVTDLYTDLNLFRPEADPAITDAYLSIANLDAIGDISDTDERQAKVLVLQNAVVALFYFGVMQCRLFDLAKDNAEKEVFRKRIIACFQPLHDLKVSLDLKIDTLSEEADYKSELTALTSLKDSPQDAPEVLIFDNACMLLDRYRH